MTASDVPESRWPAPVTARARWSPGARLAAVAQAAGPLAARARLFADRVADGSRTRVLATACWQFPIYSQTFVYEELRQMLDAGFGLRFLYSELEARDHLPSAFDALWLRKRRTFLGSARGRNDVAHFVRRMPGRVEDLIALIRQASGMSRDALLENPHFRMAFSYTRLVEAYRPSWLHSYFFYEGTLFTLVASYLLGIPRGVSCYADHMLDDFALKLVPLHLATSDVVVATSRRIMLELMTMHPQPERANVIVKPNAIDSSRFPESVRREPAAGEPYRVVCVSRLEPKKGLIDLVDAVKLVIDRGVKVEVSLVGDTDDPDPDARAYQQRVRDRLTNLGLERVVRLVGRSSAEEIRSILARSHLFVAPFVELDSGDKDGIPTALLEAMSTGIAVVTTDSGSMLEAVQDDVNGVIATQRNAGDLADVLVRLLGDAPRRARLGASAAQTVRERYEARTCDPVLHERMRAAIAAHEERRA